MNGGSPNRANGARVLDSFGNEEGVIDATARASRYGLLDEKGHAGEVLYDLELKITPGLGAAAECGRAADDDSSALQVKNGDEDKTPRTY